MRTTYIHRGLPCEVSLNLPNRNLSAKGNRLCVLAFFPLPFTKSTAMRFSAPRSTSPSPERVQFQGPSGKSSKGLKSLGLGNPRTQIRRTSTYGIHSDSESESDNDRLGPVIIPVDASEAESDQDTELADTFKYVSISPTRYVSILCNGPRGMDVYFQWVFFVFCTPFLHLPDMYQCALAHANYQKSVTPTAKPIRSASSGRDCRRDSFTYSAS